MKMNGAAMGRRKSPHWVAAVFALLLTCLLLLSCGTSRRAKGASTQGEEPVDTLVVERYPELIKEGKPKYPRKALEAGWEGTVWVTVLIDKKGKVRNVKVRTSSGYKELDDAAAKAAWKTRFKPAMQHGRPVYVWATYKVDFSLGNKKTHRK